MIDHCTVGLHICGFVYSVIGREGSLSAGIPKRISDRLAVFEALESYAASVLQGLKSRRDAADLEAFFRGEAGKVQQGGQACVQRAICEVAHVIMA